MSAAVSINDQQVEVTGDEPLFFLSDSYPPTFNFLQVCGAPDRAVSCAAINEDTDSGYSLSIVAVPEVTQTPLPTRTPSPTVSVSYRLTEGSSILYSPPPPKMTPVVEEPLSGGFTTVLSSYEPNTLFSLAITSLEFRSSQFTVTGGGNITAPISQPPSVHVDLVGSINGRPVLLGGGGPSDGRFPPTLQDIELCGGTPDRPVTCEAIRAGADTGYSVTIFATPEG